MKIRSWAADYDYEVLLEALLSKNQTSLMRRKAEIIADQTRERNEQLWQYLNAKKRWSCAQNQFFIDAKSRGSIDLEILNAWNQNSWNHSTARTRARSKWNVARDRIVELVETISTLQKVREFELNWLRDVDSKICAQIRSSESRSSFKI